MYQLATATRLAFITASVRAGRGFPLRRSVKICSNLGTMKVSRKIRMRTAMLRTITG
jgi:hypothetical protein